MATPVTVPSIEELHERRSDETVGAVLSERMKGKSFVSKEKVRSWFHSLATSKPEPMPTPDIHD